MEHSKTPGVWAIVRNLIYGFGGTASFALATLGWLGAISVGDADALIAVLISAALAANFAHVRAILTGNTLQQQIERQAWGIATRPLTRSFQMARQGVRLLRTFEASRRNHPLREVGAIGVDLVRAHERQAAGRQSGGRKAGTGGHKKPASSGSKDDEPPAHLPLIWTVHDLAGTIKVSAKTLQNQPPHHLPPAIRIPGCRGPRYRLRDVMAWLDGFGTGHRPDKPKTGKVMGRPRIASATQIAAVRGKGV